MFQISKYSKILVLQFQESQYKNKKKASSQI